jgi:hypothetical protein
MSRAGDWKIETMTGGHPVWCEISYGGSMFCKVRHTQLRDLEYAIKRAILECRDALPDSYKHEMD